MHNSGVLLTAERGQNQALSRRPVDRVFWTTRQVWNRAIRAEGGGSIYLGTKS